MADLRIRNWEKWQSYRRDRGRPPWIKVHREVMRNPDWVSLTDAQRGQLVSIWILAADRDGRIPDDPELIQKLCYMSDAPTLEVFISRGFIGPRRQSDAIVTPECRQLDALEERREETEKKHTVDKPTNLFPVSPAKDSSGNYVYPAPFERAWSVYPDRDGPNPKVGAYKAFRSRVTSGADPEDLVRASGHYADDCRYRDVEGTSFVQQAATFFGAKEPWREFVEPSTNGHAKAGGRPDFGRLT